MRQATVFRTSRVRYFVLFVIDVRSRRVQIAGINPHLSSAWMAQMAGNLTDVGDGFLRNARYLIHDRDPMFTQQFVAILRASGVATVNARRALLEVKKLHNGKFWDGLEAQLPSYSKSDGSKNRPDARCGERKLSCLFRRGAAY